MFVHYIYMYVLKNIYNMHFTHITIHSPYKLSNYFISTRRHRTIHPSFLPSFLSDKGQSPTFFIRDVVKQVATEVPARAQFILPSPGRKGHVIRQLSSLS